MRKYSIIIGLILFWFLFFGCLSKNIYSTKVDVPLIEIAKVVNDTFEVDFDSNGIPQSKGNLYVIDISRIPVGIIGNYPTAYNTTDSEVDFFCYENTTWKKIKTIKKNDSINVYKSSYPNIKYYGFKYLGNSNYEFKLFHKKSTLSSEIIFGFPEPNWTGTPSDKIIESIITLSKNELNYPLIIQKLYTYKPNSAGGININISFSNIGNKTIKYVYFDVEPFNRVGDLTISEINGKSLATIRVTDFIAPYESYGATWENVWYNQTITNFKISNIRIVYTDNSEKSISKNQIDELLEFNPIKYSLIINNDLSLEFIYEDGAVNCFGITKMDIESLEILFETNPKTIYSKFEKDLKLVFPDMKENDDTVIQNGNKKLFSIYRNKLLYETLAINIEYKFSNSEKKEIKIVNPEIIFEFTKFMYGVERLVIGK